MKWVLYVVVGILAFDAIVLFLLHRRVKQMEKMGFRYNHDEERWEWKGND